MLENYDRLTEMQFGILKELCDIGSGNAGTAISSMFGIPVDVAIPNIHVDNIDEEIKNLSGKLNEAVDFSLNIKVDFKGLIMFLFSREFTNTILETLTGMGLESISKIDEMGMSMLQEISNIASASFVNSIATMAKMVIDISPPVSIIGTVDSIMKSQENNFEHINDKVLFIENYFTCGGGIVYIILIPEIESVDKLMNKFQIK